MTPHLTGKGEHNLKYLTALKHNNRQRRGFTLAETLIVVGILVVLMGLLIPNLIQMQRELRQKELDAKAEIIYVAAQNELVKLRAGGNSQAYGANLANGTTTADMFGEPLSMDGKQYYLLRKTGDSPVDNNWMADAAESDLLGNRWVIVFDPLSATVTEVYYCSTDDINAVRGTETAENGEEFFTWKPDKDKGRTEWARKDIGKVGYYGGGKAGDAGTITKKMQLILEPDNGEKLTVTIGVPTNERLTKLELILTIKDVDGDTTWTKFSALDPYYYADLAGNSLTIVLDAVDAPFWSSDFAKNHLKTTDPNKTNLKPGKLELSLTATADGVKFDPKNGVITNSLFADNNNDDDGETGWKQTAIIRKGRHLQNLDVNHSKVPETIIHAKQEAEINFDPDNKTYSSDDEKTWADYYEDLSFTPITNPNLTDYEGNTNRIFYLNAADNSGNAGLFASIPSTQDMHFSNIRLVDASVSGRDSAGALVGAVEGDCIIDGCYVYLESLVTKPEMKPERYLITGAAVGGLVGTNNGELTIEKSFAATTLGGPLTEAVGGLVGVSTGYLSLEHAYADCYLGAASTGTVGGLAGTAVGSDTEVSECYAAGYLNAPAKNAHGLFYGGLVKTNVGKENEGSNVKSSYSVLDLSSMPMEISDVYYDDNGKENTLSANMSKLDLKTALKGNGWNTNTGATPYNLDSLSRDRIYTNPGLDDLPHYGDWKISFQPGSLVYYEAYADGTFGFSGANISSTLKNNGLLIGDGYGIVFKKDTASALTVKVYNASTAVDAPDWTQVYVAQNNVITGIYTLNGVPGSGSNVLNVGIGEGIYCIYPLDKKVVSAEPNGFWQTVDITFRLKNGDTKNLYYCFNPLLADVKQQMGDDEMKATPPTLPKKPDVPYSIAMRSPRQLNALGDYYSTKWSNLICNFVQQRTIDFSGYNWFTYTTKTGDVEQYPIGTESAPFECSYEGNCLPITGTNISSRATDYTVGLFGTTKGWLQNIIFAANVDKTDGSAKYFVQRSNVPEGATVYMGALVGHNRGTLYNCAVAGYQVRSTGDATIYTFNNSTLQIGGLVGRNDGTISNCSAVFPEIDVNGLFSNIALGGMVGRNNRTVQECYAIGHMNAEAKEGTVNVAGFVGTNMGSVSGCYSAVSTITSGAARSFAFAPTTGPRPINSYFLNNGTYNYLGELRAFSVKTEENGAVGMSYQQMMNERGTAWVRAANSLYDEWAEENASFDTSGAYYPFRGVVTNGLGYAHYGDWPAAPMMGDYGVFYWELEEGGTNDGYHFSFLGVKENDGAAVTRRRGSTLCKAHDDGGQIKQYGYGYYYDKTLSAPTATWVKKDNKDIAFWGQDTTEGSASSKAKAELERQIGGYTFVPYVTAYSEDKTGDYLYLDGDNTSATLMLTEEGYAPQSYLVSPFFANAMSRVGTADSNAGKYAYEWEAPGSAENNYMIRSVQQLRYINWNYQEHNVSTLVEDPNTVGLTQKKTFPYLQYYTNDNGDNRVRQQREAACGENSPRPVQYWVQSHDLRGDNVTNYTPIAGMDTSSQPGDGTNPIFVWFGGSYDGRSYKIQNLPIETKSFTVGIFGVTVGATIQNIILYGDGTPMDNPNTERITDKNGNALETIPVAHIIRNSKLNETGSYCIGGIIGLAYDYDVTNSTNTITNCAVAGYEIIDLSCNQNGMGYGNIGGLIGTAQVRLQNCSAVVDILECFQTRDKKYSDFGNMARIGGLAGAGLGLIDNCYTGGSVEVAEKTLYEPPKDFDENNENKLLNRKDAMHIFVGGIIGSCYQHNVTNFSGKGSATDGTVTMTNCYTYMDLPDMEGNVRAVSVLAGSADRFHRATKFYLENCYFAENTHDISYTWPGYYFTLQNSGSKEQGYEGLKTDGRYRFDSETALGMSCATLLEEIRMGNLNSLCLVILNQSDNALSATNKPYKNPDPDEQTRLTFEQLCGQETFKKAGSDIDYNIFQTLASPWGHVTTDEGGANVSGKYSFSSLPSQEGQDYPFPAVLRQVDNDNKPENDPYIHYGKWLISGAYWDNGRASMDIFEELAKTENPDTAWAEKDLTLHLKGNHGFTGTEPVPVADGVCGNLKFIVTSGERKENSGTEGAEGTEAAEPDDAEKILQVLSVTPTDASGTTLKVRIRALKDGAVTLTAKTTDDFKEEAFCSVNITAALKIDPTPSSTILTGQASDPITCQATAEKGLEITDADGTKTRAGNYTAKGTWSVMPETDKNNKAQLSVFKKSEDANAEDPWVYAYYIFDDTATDDTRIRTVEEGNVMVNKAGQPIQSVPITDNSFMVNRTHAGNCYVTVTYTYDYHSSALSASAVVQARKMGFVGLMNAEKENSGATTPLRWYQTLTRRLDGGETDIEYPLAQADRNKLTAPQGAELFLFSVAAENDLAELEKPTTEINVFENGADASTRYSVSFFTVKDEGGNPQKEITTQGDFLLHGASVRINPSEQTTEAKTVSVSVRLKEPVAENVYYTLKVDNVKAYPYELHFKSGATDATGSMHPVGIAVGSTIPDGKGYFVRTGYKFAGWKIETADGLGDTLYDNYNLQLLADPADGEKAAGLYYFSDLQSATNDNHEITLVAQWQKVSFTVYFYPGYGNGIPAVKTYNYDDRQTLPDPTTEDPPMFSDIPNNYAFLNWNTRRTGMGDTYNAGDSANLTDQDGATILLFARWKEQKMLTLQDDAQTTLGVFRDPTGSALPEDEYQQILAALPVKDGEVFCGWYYLNPQTNESIQVLDEDGKLVIEELDGVISGGQFPLTADLTLQARWRVQKKLMLQYLENGTQQTLKTYLEPTGSALTEADYKPFRDALNPNEGWQLDGWYYLDPETNKYVQVLDADGNLESTELTGFISGGQFALTADLTLQARWTQTAYLRIDELSDSVNDPSYKYVIAGNFNEDKTTAGLMTLKANKTLGLTAEKTVWSTEGVLDAKDQPVDPNFSSVMITAPATEDNAVWQLTYTTDYSGGYRVWNKIGTTTYYLRRYSEGTVDPKTKVKPDTSYMWGSSPSDRCVWNYERNGAIYRMWPRKEEDVNNGWTLGWNNSESIWKTDSGSVSWVLREQTVYTYDPF